MSVVTISNFGDLDNLLAPKDSNHYCLDRINIVIINIDDANMGRAGLSRGNLVKRIRERPSLHSVAIIFSERNGKHSSMSSKVKELL